MKAQELINHFEGTETDATEVYTEANNLDELGWDFHDAYEGWKSGKYSGQPYTQEDLFDYNAFLESTIVHILIQDESTSYALMHRSLNEKPQGYNPTGDDEQTIIDISENLDDFLKA